MIVSMPRKTRHQHLRLPQITTDLHLTRFCFYTLLSAVEFFKSGTRINNNTIFLTKCRNHFSFPISIKKRTLVKMLQTSFTRTHDLSTVNHVLIARRPRIHWHHVSSFGKPDPPSWLLSLRAEKKIHGKISLSSLSLVVYLVRHSHLCNHLRHLQLENLSPPHWVVGEYLLLFCLYRRITLPG